MSPRKNKPLQRQQVSKAFPHEHIQHLGGGTIGPVFVFRDGNDKIKRAEADLYRAPFKKMVIHSSQLLRMFGKDNHSIDVAAVTPNRHPWPNFHLVGNEEDGFEVGKLELVEYVRDGIRRDGTVVRGRAPVSKIKITPSSGTGTANRSKSRSQPNLSRKRLPGEAKPPTRRRSRAPTESKPPGQPTRISGRKKTATARAPLSHSTTTANLLDPATEPSATNSSGITLDQLRDLQEHILTKQITPFLSIPDEETYRSLLEGGPRRSRKEGTKYREALRKQLRELIEDYGEWFAILHNQYARCQWKLNEKAIMHLPVFEDLARETRD